MDYAVSDALIIYQYNRIVYLFVAFGYRNKERYYSRLRHRRLQQAHLEGPVIS